MVDEPGLTLNSFVFAVSGLLRKFAPEDDFVLARLQLKHLAFATLA